MPDAVLPSRVWNKVAGHLRGDIVGTIECGSGFTPGLAFRIAVMSPGTGLAHWFLKAIRKDHPLEAAYQAEAEAARSLPEAEAIPTLRWDGEIHGWHVLVFADAGARTVDLRPGATDVAPAVKAVNSLHQWQAPNVLPTVGDTLAPILHGWAALTRDPDFVPDDWVRQHLDYLLAIERHWISHSAGDALLHTDIRAANLVVGEAEHVRVVDWAHACRGAPWIDCAELLSHLVLAGHTSGEAEAQLAGTAMSRADDEVVTSFIVASAGYWRRSSLQPPPPGVPGLRDFQARAADAATEIIRHRVASHASSVSTSAPPALR